MPEDVESRDGVALLTVGDAFIALWQSPARLDRWQWQSHHLMRLAGTKKKGVVMVSLVLASSDPPDSATRAQMQADFRELGPKLRRIVVVPLGSSMWMSVVRTIVRASLLLSRQSAQQSVAANLDEAIRLVAEVATPETPTRFVLREAFRALAAKLDVRIEDQAATLER